MSNLLKEIYSRRELLLILVGRNLKIRYKSSSLGFFWSLLGPLFLILIYSIFAGILKFNLGRPNYLEFLVVGIIAWQFLSMCLNDALHAIVGNVNLIKKTAFPRFILPLSMVIANLVNFLLTAVVLLVFLVVKRMPFSHCELMPLVVLTQCALCLGMACLISASNVFFRDTEHLVGIVSLAWFFMTPIFYPVALQLSKLPEALHWVAFLNPMSGIMWTYRGMLMSGAAPDLAPDLSLIAISFCVSWTIMFVGVEVFQKCQIRFGDEL